MSTLEMYKWFKIEIEKKIVSQGVATIINTHLKSYLIGTVETKFIYNHFMWEIKESII